MIGPFIGDASFPNVTCILVAIVAGRPPRDNRHRQRPRSGCQMITEPPEMPTVMDPQIGRMTGKKLGQLRVIIIVLKDELDLDGLKSAPLIEVVFHIRDTEPTTQSCPVAIICH